MRAKRSSSTACIELDFYTRGMSVCVQQCKFIEALVLETVSQKINLTLLSQHVSMFLMCSFHYYITVFSKKSIRKINFIFALSSKVISDGIFVHFGLQILPVSWCKWLMMALGFFLCLFVCLFFQHTGRAGCWSWKNENITAGFNCS